MAALSDVLIQAYRQDLIEVAKRIGFFGNEKTFSQKFVVSLLEACDDAANNNSIDRSETQDIINALGIIWDNCKQKFPGIANPIMAILARIGYLPNQALFDSATPRLGFSEIVSLYSNRFLRSSNTIDGRVFLTPFQKSVWDSLDNNSRIAISAPTSAGKTFVITKWIAERLRNDDGDMCVFVAPSITLCSQIAASFKEQAKGKFEVKTTIPKLPSKKVVYVLTQEKAINHPELIRASNYLVIDEIQNIERFADDDPDRSLILLDVIEEIISNSMAKRLVVSGPMIHDLAGLTEFLFEKKFQIIENVCSPVVGVTHSFANNNGFKIQTHLSGKRKISQILKDKKEPGIEVTKYSKTAEVFMDKLLEAIPEEEAVLIFSGSTSQAAGIARKLKGVSTTSSDLADYSSETVSIDYDLTRCLKLGVAYHHARIPSHLRKCVELGFLNGEIKQIVATTTLLQGVNFPAKHIIIRNPSIGSSRESLKLTEYEQANLRGRAGRLFKDFVGRAYLINEDAFSENGQIELLPQKEVQNSLLVRYEENQEQIIQDLLDVSNSIQADPAMSALIATKVSLGGQRGLDSLGKMGITLTKQQIAAIKSSVGKLRLDPEFHLKFRRIDPHTLHELYKLAKNNQFVPDITGKNFSASLIRLVTSINEICPQYTSRKLGAEAEKIERFCYLVHAWATGTELTKIVQTSGKYYRSIDDLVKAIQSNIVYGLTQLLSPIMFLQTKKNLTIEACENGSFHKSDLDMILKGIPREVAVRSRLQKANHRWDKILFETAI